MIQKELTDRELLMSYQLELQTLGYAKSTVFTKIRNLINFKTFTRKAYIETTAKDLHFFTIHLQNKALHSSTIKHYYHDVSQFFIYLERTSFICKNPFNFYELQLIKQAKRTRDIITQQEAIQLYKAVKNDTEKLLLHLCYGCGLRAKELERLNVKDVLLTQQLIKVEKGKNSQHRVVPITPAMLLDFINYLEFRNKQLVTTKALLLNKKENRLKAYTARGVLQEIVKRSAILLNKRNITLHSLRHSIATHLLENGMNVNYVQQFLGHKQLETTETYVRIHKEQLKNLV